MNFLPRVVSRSKTTGRIALYSAILGCPLVLHATPPPAPYWWFAGSVPPVSGTPQALAVANIGQAKYMAKCALESLYLSNPTVADLIASDLVGPGKPIATWVPPTAGTPGATAQYAPLLVGQLKAIADPFYTRLNSAAPAWLASQRLTNGTQDSVNPSYIFPWTSTATDDANKAIASVGQLKAVFALRFDADSDADQLPDLWETTYLGNISAGAVTDADGDGFTNLQEYLSGTNPNDSISRPQIGAISVGLNHNLVLGRDSRIWSWGRNTYGQLGDGTNVQRKKPIPVVLVSGMGRIVAISAGDDFSGAVDENGALWMWGYNERKQLGTNNGLNANLPVRISFPPTTNIKLIACGSYHSLAVDQVGNLWAWGDNSYGGLGNGLYSSVPVESPILITRPSGMGTIVGISAAYYCSYALDSNGKIWAWGRNDQGQLGNGSTTLSATPVQVDLSNGLNPLPAFVSVSADGLYVVARAADGKLWSWGWNGYGMLGLGNNITQTRPALITSGLSTALSVTAGDRHALAIANDEHAWSWGDNASGQLGINSTSQSLAPVPIPTSGGLLNVAAMGGGSDHSLAALKDGSVWAWGYNYFGQIGDDSNTQRLSPVRISQFNIGRDDSDSDGLPDSWEYFYFGNLAQGALTSFNNEGVTNWKKYLLGLNPLAPDTDLDGLSDAWELAHGLDPLNPFDSRYDSDGDGLTNLQEFGVGTDLYNPDTNGDGLLDGPSVQLGVDPVSADSDGDLLTIAQEQVLGTSPFLRDTDEDGVADNLDAFPLDPFRSVAPTGNSGDVTPPQITLTAPAGAVPN